MEFRASHRFADISPTKVRPVAKLIANRPVDEALHTLKFIHNRGARYLEKTLLSAKANAEDRGARDAEDMIVSVARVDEAPRLKRIQPRARGMAFPILKRLCHIHVEISG